jgi:hypothetical protein
VNRVVLSLLPLPIALIACNGKVTRAQCSEMLDRYVDMTVASEREPERAVRKGEARYVRVQEQCEAEITSREYRCAMKAPSPETWQACID